MQNKCDTMGADEVIEGSNDDYRHLIQVKRAEIGFIFTIPRDGQFDVFLIYQKLIFI